MILPSKFLNGLLIWSFIGKKWPFRILKMVGFAVFSLSLAASLEKPISAQKPNVIFLLVDDLGWSDVGFNGAKHYRTPNIDRLANSGIIFDNAYSCGPNCAPSRASLMSGQYTPRHRVITVGNSDRGKSKHRRLIPVKNQTHLDGDVVTLAELFKTAGYKTGFFGKWHLGKAASESGPLAQGFGVNVGGNHTGHPKSYFSPFKNPQLPDGPRDQYLTDRLGDEVVKFITANHSKPFFAQVSFYSVHTPIQAKPELTAKYQTPELKGLINPKYAAMIDSVDQAVGKIVSKLDELNIRNNTLIVFSSDNGGLGSVTSNEPLRGSKGMLYEGGIRVPLAISWPTQFKASTRSPAPTTAVDFFVTFAEILKSKDPETASSLDRLLENQTLDGLSLLPLVRKQSATENIDGFQQRSLFWHFPAYLQGKNAKGARDNLFRTRPAAAIRKGNWKLIRYYEDDHLELYDLNADLSERNNLAEQVPDKANELATELLQWQQEVRAKIPTSANPNYDPTDK